MTDAGGKDAYIRRCLDAVGYEFCTIPVFAKAVGLGQRTAYALLDPIEKIGSRRSVAAMAARAWDATHRDRKRNY